MNNFRRLALALALGSTFGSAHAYVNIVFDYSYDSSGFFTAERRATLEQAAQAFETRVFDDLTAITSTPGGNGVVLNLGPLGSSNVGQQVTNANIAANPSASPDHDQTTTSPNTTGSAVRLHPPCSEGTAT